MVSFEEISEKDLTELLKERLDPEYWVLNDFHTIIERAKIIPERNIVCFKLSFLDLYLDTRDLSYVDAHPKEDV